MGNVGRSALASSKPNAEPDQDMTSARRHRARRFTRGLLPPLPELSKTRQRMTRLTRSVRLTKAQAEWHPVQAAPESQPTEQRWTREPSSALNLYLHLTRERIRQLQNLALKKPRRMLEEPEAIEVAA